MRSKIVAGNWKSNLTIEEAKNLFNKVNKLNSRADGSVEIIVAPPSPYLSALPNSQSIQLASQNCSRTAFGAYTGEISAEMLVSLGVNITLIGHSERRANFGESQEVVSDKVGRALEGGLRVIFCCGEELSAREDGGHFAVVKSQLESALFGLSSAQMQSVIIAYEPVWAIGTGVTASAEQAQEMHAFIRKEIEAYFGVATAQNTSILYGGSCKPANAKELFGQADVDGGLIGGASLKAEDFTAIISSF